MRFHWRREEHALQLVTEADGDEYAKPYWNEATTAHFCFVLLSKRPVQPKWIQENFFVMRVA